MKKIVPIFLISGFLLTFQTADSQTIIHEEQFNEGTLGTWTQYDVSGPQSWDYFEFDGKEFARMSGFDGMPIVNEDWLISPALDLEQFPDEVLTFESAQNFDGPDLELYYSTDYDGSSDPSMQGTWEDLTDQVTWSGGNFEFVESGDIDLSGVSGSSVYLGFRYTSDANGAKVWEIDSVIVKGGLSSSVFEIQQRKLIEKVVVVEDELQFELLQDASNLSLAIFDLNGREVYAVPAQSYFQGSNSIALPTLTTGVYILQARSKEGISSRKFVR